MSYRLICVSKQPENNLLSIIPAVLECIYQYIGMYIDTVITLWNEICILICDNEILTILNVIALQIIHFFKYLYIFSC